MAERGVRLTTLEEAFRFAQAVIKSGLAPKGITTPEQALIAIQAGAELGFSPMRALASVTVINGRAGLWGEAALAKIHQSGVCSRPPVVAIEGEGDERRGVVRFQRHDMPERVEVSFSIAEAKRAGLWGKGGAWSQYPDDMLGWRAVARMCKRYFGDVLLGLTVVEELRDYPVEPRAVAPPPEPDPLLVQPSNFGAPPIEAEVITEPSQARQQVPESGTQAGD
ncbi:MAG TPA: hypothetical protein VNL91_03910, partial [Thermoanaerobaculia bacterium]|nr:hypothetical protein [Thermoanaerobaculia bacterium]